MTHRVQIESWRLRLDLNQCNMFCRHTSEPLEYEAKKTSHAGFEIKIQVKFAVCDFVKTERCFELLRC